MWRSVALLVLMLAVSGCGLLGNSVIIGEGEVGVVFDATTGELQEPLGPGTYTIPPTNEVFIYQTSEQTFTVAGEDAINARARDGASLNIELRVIYGIDPDNVNTLHRRYGLTYADTLIAPTLRRIVREVAAEQTSDELRADDGAGFAIHLTDALNEQLAVENIIVEQVIIDTPGLPE